MERDLLLEGLEIPQILVTFEFLSILLTGLRLVLILIANLRLIILDTPFR